MKTNSFKSMLAMGIVAGLLVTQSSCDSSQQTDNAQGTATEVEATGEAAEESMGMDVPNFSTVSGETKSQIEQVYKDYLIVKDGLVAAEPEAVKKAAQQLTDDVKKIDASQLNDAQKAFLEKQTNQIQEDAQQLVDAGDIDQQREQLNTLSESTFVMVKAFDANSSEAYYQYCPMAQDNKGGYWLSQTKEIKNPYFGDKMLKCGENKATLN